MALNRRGRLYSTDPNCFVSPKPQTVCKPHEEIQHRGRRGEYLLGLDIRRNRVSTHLLIELVAQLDDVLEIVGEDTLRGIPAIPNLGLPQEIESRSMDYPCVRLNNNRSIIAGNSPAISW